MSIRRIASYLGLIDPPNRDLPECLNHAVSLETRYNRTRDTKLLAEAIELNRRCLILCPPGHPDRYIVCANLSWALRRRYHDTGVLNLLPEVIDLDREVLGLCAPGHAFRHQSCHNLALSLFEQHNHTGDELLLTEAIDQGREALGLRPQGHHARHHSCSDLALILCAYYQRTGDKGMLAEAIVLNREALALRPPGHPDRHVSSSNLAISLLTHYLHNGDTNILFESLDFHREGLSLRPEGHPDRRMSCANLAYGLQQCYNMNGDEKLLVESIGFHREALSLFPLGHPDRHRACSNVAMALLAQYNSTGDESLLIESINLNREALASVPPGHPDGYIPRCNLAVSLHGLYNQNGSQHLLAEINDLQQTALESLPPGHPDRHNLCSNLASSLRLRYNLTGDGSLLTLSIDLDREALALRPPGHPGRSISCSSLGTALWTRFIQTGDESLLAESMKLHREGLSLHPPGHQNRPILCCNLATTLLSDYYYNRNESLLIESIDLQREGLILYPRGHPDRSHSCSNLALLLSIRYQSTGDEGLLTEVVDLHREALTERPTGHPDRCISSVLLAWSLRTRYQYTTDESLLDEAMGYLHEAINIVPIHSQWRSFTYLSDIHLIKSASHYNPLLACDYLTQSLRHQPDDPSVALSAVIHVLNIFWAQLSADSHQIRQTLIPVYQHTMTLLPLLSNPVLDTGSQLQRLRDFYQLGSEAFVNAVLAGDWSAGLEQLEVSQGIVWSQYLHQRDPQFRKVPAASAAELEYCLLAIARHRAAPPTNTSHDELHKYSSRMYAAIREVRVQPGLERFMLGEAYGTICEVAATHPVVLLVGARGHFYALIIASGKICGNEPLRLDLTDAELEFSSVYSEQSPYRGTPLPHGGDADTRGMKIRSHMTPLNRYLRLLWMKVVKPVFDVLQLHPSSASDRPRLYWCPTGPFTQAPLHAAGMHDELRPQRTCCTDYVISSYTPTLTSLLRTQRVTAPLGRQNLALMLLAECEAQEKLPKIPGVELELRDIADIASTNDIKVINFISGSTTVAGTIETIRMANIVHFACHGVQDLKDATKSGFCLGDGRLNISDLIKMDIKQGFLAFLSACETARGSDDQPDQAMHLAAAMLFAGFKNVIATMWAISDEDGPKVAKWFYEDLLAKEVITTDAAAFALDYAVSQLRKSGVASYRWVPFIHMGA